MNNIYSFKIVRFALILIALGCLAVSVKSQKNISQSVDLSEAEKRESIELAKRFIERLEKENDFSPVMDELFITDFPKHYLHDKEGFPFEGVFDFKLANDISEKDFRRYCVAYLNLHWIGLAYSTSKFNIDDEKELGSPEPIEKWYPPGMLDRLMIEAMESDTPTHNIEVFNAQLTALEHAGVIGRQYLAKRSQKELDLYKQNYKVLEKRRSFILRPIGEKYPEGFYGFPPNTRFIEIEIGLFDLTMTNIDGHLKIITVMPYVD